ncbi:MAG TPA: hypothetical protein VGL81_35310 [Polyangiaceae bacterium]|jgi:hypothetical protein
MASKVYDPRKTTVYPDQSTLSDAFKAHRNQADAAFLPLRDWFGRVAREANLCLSMVHLIELAAWGDEAIADEMAHWYGTLPIVWVYLIDGVEAFEREQWTKVAANVPVDTGPPCFASSFAGSFRRFWEDGVQELLVSPEPEFAMMRAARSDRWREIWRRRYIEPFLAHLVRISQNHHEHRAIDGWTEEMGKSDVERNSLDAIRAYARWADLCLRCNNRDAAYAARRYPSEAVPQLLVELYARNPRTLPAQRIVRAFNAGVVSRMDRGHIDKNGQPSNSLRASLSSSFADFMHLVGAAYCDVFTCDGPVAGWIGEVRRTLGHPRRQLTLQGYDGGAQAFVRDLMATWP